MAKIGFEYIAAMELDDANAKSLEAVKYKGELKEIGPGATVTGTPSSSDVKDYGDDRVLETDVSWTGGTLNLELNEPTQKNEAWLLGHTYNESPDDENKKGHVIRNANDIPPYVGIGFVGKSRSGRKTIYKAKVYLKVQFKEPTDEYSTRQNNVTFSHTTLEGNMFQLENGDWKTEKQCDDLASAKAFISKILASGE